LLIEGQEGVSWPQWQALARACEQHSIAALFRSDHYLDSMHPERGSLDAWGVLNALAAVTSTLRLGTMVSPAPPRYVDWFQALPRSQALLAGALHRRVSSDARARHAEELVNAEVVGDAVDACEPEDKQCDSERADDRERNQANARDSVGHERPSATSQPPGPYVARERFDRHRT
jgi:Luciferase-like monooxygenase